MQTTFDELLVEENVQTVEELFEKYDIEELLEHFHTDGL
jgi:hypothetical protein